MVVAPTGETVVHCGTSNSFTPPRPDECVANAQLIATAPQMLDVLHRCEMWLGTHPEGNAMQAVCQAVILKAEGHS